MHILIITDWETNYHTAFEVATNGQKTQVNTHRGDLESFKSIIRSSYKNGNRLGFKYAKASTQQETHDFLVEGEAVQSGKRAWFGHTVKAPSEAAARTLALGDLQQMNFTQIRIKAVVREGVK